MISTDSQITDQKISREFNSRLARLKPGQLVSAVLLLQLSKAHSSTTRSVRSKRSAIMSAVRETSAESLDEIDQMLAQYGGRRMEDTTSVLGSLAVEVSVEGLKALIGLKQIKAVLEDQSIHSLYMQG
ncbi:MAG: hypothetical protein ABW168_00110 [Sedimenticola sp.]